MDKIKIYVLGNRFTHKSTTNEDQVTVEDVRKVLKTIPNFLETYKTNDYLFVEANDNQEILFAFANETELLNSEEGGHESIVVNTYGLDVNTTNSEVLKNYLENAGIDFEYCLGEVSKTQIEGNTLFFLILDI